MSTMTEPATFNFSNPLTDVDDVLISCRAARVWDNKGLRRASSSRPASVGVTLRVFRGQEGQAKLLFQTRDGVADIRRRQSQAFGGGPESLRIAHRNKYGKIVQGWLAIVLHGDQSNLKSSSYQIGWPLLHWFAPGTTARQTAYAGA
jgi:hypothetical protein